MKISKLFHSLYALLMLAPVFAVGGAMAFNILNPNSVQNVETDNISINTEITYQYNTNPISNHSDFVIGNVYRLYEYNEDLDLEISDYLDSIEGNYFDIDSTCLGFGGFSLANTSGGYGFENGEQVLSDFNFDYGSVYFTSDGYGYIQFSFYFTNNVIMAVEGTFYYFDFICDSNFFNNNEINNELFNTYIFPCPVTYTYSISSLENYTIVTNNVDTNLQDTFYIALDTMQDSPIFGWADTSFLAEPFSYIFGLFGIPSGSPFITLLSYWLSISIIWLVFDLVMYVPLLVHGWIDKGGIE